MFKRKNSINRNEKYKRKEKKSFENEKQNREKYDKSLKNKYRDKKLKTKTYMTQANQIDHENTSSNDHDDYYHFENLNYFDSDYEKFDDSKNTVFINNVISIDILCRRCREIF